jgi:hypothetical protein
MDANEQLIAVFARTLYRITGSSKIKNEVSTNLYRVKNKIWIFSIVIWAAILVFWLRMR